MLGAHAVQLAPGPGLHVVAAVEAAQLVQRTGKCRIVLRLTAFGLGRALVVAPPGVAATVVARKHAFERVAVLSIDQRRIEAL